MSTDFAPDVAADMARVGDAVAADHCKHIAVTVRKLFLRGGFIATCDKCGKTSRTRPSRSAAITDLCGLRVTETH